MASLGGSSSQPAGNVTQTVNKDPWSPQQPYLKKQFSEAENIYNSLTPEYYAGSTVAPLSAPTQTALNLYEGRALAGSPLVNQAQDVLSNTLGGGFLGSNPALQSAIDAASSGIVRNFQTAVKPGVDSSFTKAGRYGSNAYKNSMDDAEINLSKSLGNIASNMAYTDHARERGIQNNAIALADPLSQSDYNDISQLGRVGSVYDSQGQAELSADVDRWNFEQNKPANKLGQFASLVGGGYGGTTTNSTPYFNNKGASALSGALGGLGAAAKLGGGMGNFGTWGLGALGALGGLL